MCVGGSAMFFGDLPGDRKNIPWSRGVGVGGINFYKHMGGGQNSVFIKNVSASGGFAPQTPLLIHF